MERFEKVTPQPGPVSVIHQAYEPDIDKLDHVSFDIKMAGVTANMSTRIVLEREFTVQVQRGTEDEFLYKTNSAQFHVNRPCKVTNTHFAVLPGFVLQQNMDKAFLNFNGGSTVLDTKWLSNYSRLYPQSLKSHIRGSGRSFSNHNDKVERELYLNGSSVRYCYPSRNDRRLKQIDREETQRLHWEGDPIGDLNYTLTSDFTTLFGWPQDFKNVHNAVLIPSNAYPLSVQFAQYYQQHLKAADDNNYDTLLNLIKSVFNHTTQAWTNMQDPAHTQIRALARNYFVHRVSQNPDAHGVMHTDYFGLDMDLSKPFQLDANLQMHVRTLSLFYQFMGMLIPHLLSLYNSSAGDTVRNHRNLTVHLANMVADATVMEAAQARLTAGGQTPAQIAADNTIIFNITGNLNANGLPTVPNANGDAVSVQIQALLDNATTQLAQHENNLWGIYRDVDQARDFEDQLVLLNRWAHYIEGSLQKDEFSMSQKYTAGTVKIYEPLMIGPAHADFGCWSKNSSVLPFIERFRLGMRFDPNARYFELDQSHAGDIDSSFWFGVTFIPQLVPVSVKSKLHVTFIEQPSPLPIAIGYLDTMTRKIGDFTLDKNQSKTFEFREISLRRVPTVIMFYTRNRPPYQLNELYTDKAASITNVSLRTDLSASVLKIDGRHTIDIITSESFREYIPPIDLTGNCLALPWNKLPRRKDAFGDFDNLHGEITIQQDWHDQVYGEVFVTCFYQDSYMDVKRNYQVSRTMLDPV